MLSDIVYLPVSNPTPYIVAGFFTVDYLGLAEKFSRNLSANNIPHVLYYAPSPALPLTSESWQHITHLKPTVVERVFKDFPQKTVILMDVDCTIAPATTMPFEFYGDIHAYLGVRISQKWYRRRQATRAIFSSRTIAFHPTVGTHQLLKSWRALCACRPDLTDEQALTFAIAKTPSLKIAMLDEKLAAREEDRAPKGALITHRSARRSRKAAWRRRWRDFRTWCAEPF